MKKPTSRNRHLGTSFDEFLDEQGIRADVDSAAEKRVLAWQIEDAMHKQGVTKSQMARRMATSRAAVDRLLDPENASVTLLTMSRAAAALGARLQIALAAPRAPSQAVRRRK
jgi:antitoxin HicB